MYGDGCATCGPLVVAHHCTPQCQLEQTENLGDTLTRMLWSSGRNVGKVFSLFLAGIYRRTLYRSCNTQLRSPHFTYYAVWMHAPRVKSREGDSPVWSPWDGENPNGTADWQNAERS